MLTYFSLFSSSFVFYLVLALLFVSYIFSEFGVWDLKLTNPKLGDRPQLWPVLPPVTVYYFHKKLHHRSSTRF